jgi:uncharacterized protein
MISADRNRMKKTILISGGSGMIGQEVAQFLSELGYGIRLLTRKKNTQLPWEQFLWNPEKQYVELGALDLIYGVVHLAGESIATKRWTPDRKQILKDSRILSLRFLIDQVNERVAKPTIFISSSAIGIYGHRPQESLVESSAPAHQGFLAELCLEWEEEMVRLHTSIRQSIVRIGLVLSTKDGILAQSIRPARWGLAPLFGRGDQTYSWIHIRDLARVFHHIIKYNDSHGVYHGTAPNPITQKVFAQSICTSLSRPAVPIPAPRWLMRLVLGEFADALYESQMVLPEKLIHEGFEYSFPTLGPALISLIRDKP